MKNAVKLTFLAPLAIAAALAVSPASAKLNPFEQLPFDQPDVVSLHTGPAAAMLERNYFQAPPAPAPVAVNKPAGKCTVQMLVFDKARLASACY
jgi:hypothetical protein